MSIPWENRSYCGKLVADGAGKKVHLFGWVDAIRDHGQILFIHLRDISGIVQVVFDLEKKHFATVTDLREEYVLEVQGKVRLREKGTENPNIQTGKIEVVATSVNILSQSKGLPFQISEKAMVYGESLKANPDKVDEELRLQYRYLDLRRPSMQSHLIKRHQIARCIREYLDKQGFLELETPFLTKSTPEGARDYLVPSRVHPGRFYALPQSPQLFKQLFMMSGMERYFQIVRCFRDEDLPSGNVAFSKWPPISPLLSGQYSMVILSPAFSVVLLQPRPDSTDGEPFSNAQRSYLPGCSWLGTYIQTKTCGFFHSSFATVPLTVRVPEPSNIA